jgi:two-component system, chemotaxis family, sensor kinase CheA
MSGLVEGAGEREREREREPRPDWERRAEAAEKTVAVLKKKVVELYNGDPSAMHQKLVAAKRREAENRQRREVAEMRATELAHYSSTLEAEVARRIASAKTILDNVTFGFLVVDPHLVVQPETTRSCDTLFETGARRPRSAVEASTAPSGSIEGRRLTELLQLDPRASDQFRLACEQVFDDLLPEAVSLAQVPRKCTLRSGRVLRVEGSAIRDDIGAVGALLFTISDITDLELAVRESQTHRALIGILKEKDGFQAFLTETRAQLELGVEGIADQPFARRVVHTVKGNSSSYGLLAVVDVIHGIEEKPSLTSEDFDAIGEALRAFLRTHEAVLELDYDRLAAPRFSLSATQLTEFRALTAKLGEAGEELRRWSAAVVARPAAELVGPLADFTAKLAERLGKNVSFELSGGHVCLDVETTRGVMMSLSHLVRNAVDHGIEASGQRGEKSPRGVVRVTVQEDERRYRIEVADDGRGIDVAKVAARAVARGLVSREHLATLPDAGLSLLFLDGVSTAEHTTTLSGRGVGLSAVKSAVEAVHGTLTLHTHAGRGTTFVLDVPKPGLLPKDLS